MANKTFDFGKLKRSFFYTKLKDGKGLVVNMPKKSTFEEMQKINELNDSELEDKDVYETLLGLMAEILSNNKTKEKITVSYLEKTDYDVEEIIEFINAYSDFVNSIKANPN